MTKKKSTHFTDEYLARLHVGARARIHQNAKKLRHQQTGAEAKLWLLLRNRQLKGKKFRRQHAIDNYVVDFYCNECKLAIELDGNFHVDVETKEYDRSRTLSLNELEITVLRFWNDEVLRQSDKVLKKIADYLN